MENQKPRKKGRAKKIRPRIRVNLIPVYEDTVQSAARRKRFSLWCAPLSRLMPAMISFGSKGASVLLAPWWVAPGRRGDSGAEDIEVIKSEGSFIVGSNGRRYIDFVMGWCVGSLGWGTEPL